MPSASTSTCRCSRARRGSSRRCAAPTRASATSKLAERLREAIPDLALGTDIIVGFPGETEADFEETLAVVEEVRYDSAFTFIYSPRRGTDAATMADQVPEAVKHERLERLVEVVQRIAAERNAERVGRVEQVLVEGQSRTDETLLRGRTRRNTTVFHRLGAARRPRRRRDRGIDLDDAARLRRHRRSRLTAAAMVAVIAVFGPTASGKTAVAEEVADRLGTEVVSCDAMQVYRGLPILTNQPSRPTALVGIRDLSEEMSVGAYATLAHAAIDELVAARRDGRSSAAARGSTCGPRSPTWTCRRRPVQGVRERVLAEVEADPAAAHARLAELDPRAAEAVHANDQRRLVRALELAETGASLVPRRRPPLGEHDPAPDA